MQAYSIVLVLALRRSLYVGSIPIYLNTPIPTGFHHIVILHRICVRAFARLFIDPISMIVGKYPRALIAGCVLVRCPLQRFDRENPSVSR